MSRRRNVVDEDAVRAEYAANVSMGKLIRKYKIAHGRLKIILGHVKEEEVKPYDKLVPVNSIDMESPDIEYFKVDGRKQRQLIGLMLDRAKTAILKTDLGINTKVDNNYRLSTKELKELAETLRLLMPVISVVAYYPWGAKEAGKDGQVLGDNDLYGDNI